MEEFGRADWRSDAFGLQRNVEVLRLIYDTAPIGLAFLSPDCRYLQINQRLTEICGISIEGHLGRTVRECVPMLADSVEAIVRSIMMTGEPVTGIEVSGQRPGENAHRTWTTYWHPVRGLQGGVVGVNVAAEEITERKLTEAKLREREQQFYSLSDSIPQLVWMADETGRIFWFNSRWYDYTGMPSVDCEPHDWQNVLDPASRMKTDLDWQQALRKGAPLELELGLRRRDGEYHPFLTRVIPLRDASGMVYRWIGTHVDISEQKRREEHIRFIALELSHRTKNLLAVVIAVAKQTALYANDIQQYQECFVNRLDALAHCHDLLVRDNWQGAPLHDLVMAQMKPFNETNSNRIKASGPLVILRPDAVQNLGLALHELATNASKHGALSNTFGNILIDWQIDPESGRVRVLWSEQGGPPVIPPHKHGFGHVVIEQVVPRALDGHGKLEFLPTGVNWAFDFLNRNE
jgi:PAS domain S-box-containing protein